MIGDNLSDTSRQSNKTTKEGTGALLGANIAMLNKPMMMQPARTDYGGIIEAEMEDDTEDLPVMRQRRGKDRARQKSLEHD